MEQQASNLLFSQFGSHGHTEEARVECLDNFWLRTLENSLLLVFLSYTEVEASRPLDPITH